MPALKKTLGFYPEPLSLRAGPISVHPLPEFDTVVEDVQAWEDLDKGWIYPPRLQSLKAGASRELPYRTRVFPLPKTHLIEHKDATADGHLDFIVWVLSFFVGMRLTTEEAGFLDATPIRRGMLVDFVLVGQSLSRALELADSFWKANPPQTRNPLRFEAAVHALFLGQYPQALQFERFIYLYTALDACYRLVASSKKLRKDVPHTSRIKWTCDQLGLDVPGWASPQTPTTTRATRIAPIRNDALHEALFMDSPLGFAVHRFNPNGGAEYPIDSEMRNLVCRLLVALLAGDAPPAAAACTCPARARTACRTR